jgi:hypothetical protein
MYAILIILLLLLIASLINSFLFYYDKKDDIMRGGIIDTSLIPNNIGFTNYIVFYNKNNNYNLCHKSKKDFSDKPYIDIVFYDQIKDFYKKNYNKTFIIGDNKNSTHIDIRPYLERINNIM